MANAFATTLQSLMATYNPGNGAGPQLMPAPFYTSVFAAGNWDAAANVPNLRDKQGTSWSAFKVATAGTTSVDGISTWAVGDYCVFNPTVGVHFKIDGATGQITAPPLSDHAGASSFNQADANNLAQAGGTSQRSATNGIVAHSGGGQGSAVQLTTDINRVITAAASGDSVKLPVSKPGMMIVVTNVAAANPINVFPSSGEIINALSADTALSVVATKSIIFICAVAGTWNTLLTA